MPRPNPTTAPDERPARVQSFLRYTLPSLALAGGVGALELLRSRFQHRQVFLPSRYPTGVWDPSAYGVAFEDSWFTGPGGVELHGWWMPHRRAALTVVYCHGNSGSIADRIGVYRRLLRLRVNVFAFDYRGYGRSSGEPSEKGLYDDVQTAYDHVTGRLGVDPRRIVLFGHSLGGAVAVDAALHRPAAGLVVQASFTDVRDMARHFYGGTPLPWIARNAFRSIDKVGRLDGLPKLFIHGTADGTVPFPLGERLFAAAGEPKEWHPVTNAGHNDIAHHGGLRYLWTLYRFFRRCQAGAASTRPARPLRAEEAAPTPSP